MLKLCCKIKNRLGLNTHKFQLPNGKPRILGDFELIKLGQAFGQGAQGAKEGDGPTTLVG